MCIVMGADTATIPSLRQAPDVRRNLQSMKSCQIFLVIVVSLGSCLQKKKLEIEVLKIDQQFMVNLKSESYLLDSRILGPGEFYSEDVYFDKKKSIKIRLLKDSLGNVVAINKSKEGVILFIAEYYPNGQIKGKLSYVDGKINGPATYYYASGAKEREGQWHDHTPFGRWKTYKENGELLSTIYYDDNGHLIKTDSAK